MAQQSALLPDDLIWCEGMPDWQAAQALFPPKNPSPAVTVAPKAKTNKLVAPLVVGLVLIGLGMLWIVLQATSKHQREAIAATKVAASPTPPPKPLEGPLGMTREEIATRFGPHKVYEYFEQDPNETNHTRNGVNITVSYFNGRADQIEYTVNSRSDVLDILGTYGDYSTSWDEQDTSDLNKTLLQLQVQGSYPADVDSTHYKWQSRVRHPSYGLAFADYSLGFRNLTVETEERVNRLRKESSENAQKEEKERSERFKGL